MVVSKAQGKLTNNLKLMFELLAKRAIKKMRYFNNDDRQDCYQSGLLSLFTNWYHFDIDKTSNPFAYLTEIYKRSLAQQYNSLYKKKGDNEHKIRLISINSANDGQGMYSL